MQCYTAKEVGHFFFLKILYFVNQCSTDLKAKIKKPAFKNRHKVIE